MPDDPRRHLPPPTPRSEPRIKVPGGASTQQAIEAERRIADRIRPRTAIPIPTIKGAAARRVALAEARHRLNEPEMAFRDDGPEVLLRAGDERGSVALACLLLENLQRHGATHAPARPLQQVLDRLLVSLTQKEVMQIEVEAYELMQWIGRAMNPYFDADADPRPPDAIHEDGHAAGLELLRRAIAERFDVEITYYTGGRGEWTERRVTPLRISAETYLTAWCHERMDERVFRVSRIGTVERVLR